MTLLIGFRPTTGPLQWLALLGIVALILFAITWLSLGLGMAVTSVESASNLATVLLLLPFLGSGFVPTDTTPGVLRVFAQDQLFTSFIETIRGLLIGTLVGTNAVLAIAWCIAMALGG